MGQQACFDIVLIGDRPVLFDAIEFDEAIATCDVLYDLGFLLMDLSTRGLRSHPILFVGLDVSQKMTAICVIDNAGRRLWRVVRYAGTRQV